jgi:hypothetical protein
MKHFSRQDVKSSIYGKPKNIQRQNQNVFGKGENTVQEPIKSGDVCIVIDGAMGKDSPNIGKQVTVHGLRGEHSVYGRIWRCAGKDLVTEYAAKGNSCDFAQSWLQKVPPEPLDKQDQVEELKAA